MSQKKDPQILFTQASETSFSGPLGYSALHFGWKDSYSIFFFCFKILVVAGGWGGLALFLKSLLNLNQPCFGFLALRHAGSYLPDQGSDSYPPALEGEVVTPGPPEKSPYSIFLH